MDFTFPELKARLAEVSDKLVHLRESL